MAVYTDVSDGALAEFLTAYEIGSLVAFRGIAEGVENSNFSLRTTQGDYILTLYERRVDPSDLPWFLGLMRHLAGRGIVCPQPIAARDGQSLRSLAGRPAAITSFLPGIWPRRAEVSHCHSLGAILARLHRAGADFAPPRPNALGPAAWRPLFARSAAQADTLQPGLAAEIDAALDHVLGRWPAHLPRGQIHADLFPDNVFFLDGAVSGVIDFYFACTDLLAYDLAIAVNAWCFEPDCSLNVTKLRALLRGYDSVRAITADEREYLPVLAAGAALRFLLTRLYDWLNTPADAFVTRKNPLDYLRRLRFHLAAAADEAYHV